MNSEISGTVAGLQQVAQHVEDLDRAVDFYRDVLGLRLITRFDPPGLAFFDLGGPRLLLEAAAPSAVLYLRVANVAQATEHLRAAGVTIEGEPHLIHTDQDGLFGAVGEEEWMAFFRDSENNLIGLSSPRPAGPPATS
ncbi:MAG: VOC family protein [Actinobacteria bacterium]|nr:VOC family protein [Actinomycetota bacterium]